MMPRILRRILIPLILVLLIITMFYFVFCTLDGLRLAINLTNKVMPGSISTEQLNGSILGPITATELRYKSQQQNIVVHNFYFEWSLESLLLNRFAIKKVNAEKVVVKINVLKEKQDSKLNWSSLLAGMNLPIKLQLQNISLNNISVYYYNDNNKPIVINQILLNLSSSHTRLNKLNFKLLAPDASINISGQTNKKQDYSWRIKIGNLNDFIAKSYGAINSAGRFVNTVGKRDGTLDATLQCANIKYGGVSLADLRSNILLTLDKKRHSSFSLQAKKIMFGNYMVNNIGLHGQMIVNSAMKKHPAAQLDLHLQPTTIALITPYQVHNMHLQGGALTAVLHDRHLATTIEIKPENQAALKAELALDNGKKVKGQMDWHTSKLSFLPMIIPQLESVHGVLDTQLQVGGSLSRPAITGSVALQHADAVIPSLNLHLRNIHLEIKGDRSTVHYLAGVQSGSGQLNITGNSNLSSVGHPTRFDIKGDNFLVSDSAALQLHVSPDLHLLLHNKMVKITGDFHVPQAEIKAIDLDTTDTLPQDVVFVDHKHQDTFVARSFLKVHSNVKLILGDKVRLNAMNISGWLSGTINIKDQPEMGTTAIGMLSIHNGAYIAFGQKLKINYGRLNFTGGLITNPSLNVEAVREIKSTGSTGLFDIGEQNLVVGVRLQGELLHPQTKLFSEPAGLSDADILSYLVLGQSSSQVGENKANLLFSAASALDFGGSGGMSGVTSALQNKFGFADFGLQTETTRDVDQDTTTTSTSFVLGKYLSPSLYVSYSVGILHADSILRVRYRLAKKWFLQTEAGMQSQGIDLLYTIDRK